MSKPISLLGFPFVIYPSHDLVGGENEYRIIHSPDEKHRDDKECHTTCKGESIRVI